MPEDEFDRYLTLLAKTLRLSEAQRRAIAAELRDHMEHRLDELTAQGLPREQAIQTALDEFGDASALANNLTRNNPAQRQQRRNRLQTSFGTIAACAAITFAIVILNPLRNDGPSAPSLADAEKQDTPTSMPVMAAIIEKESGITYRNTAKIILRGDEASGTAGTNVVLTDLDEYAIQDIWDTIYQSRPYDHVAMSGYREIEFYSDADADKPDIVLYVNETSATHTNRNDMKFRCPGLPKLLDEIWRTREASN